MLGWELPPHNSGGLGVACYQMCKHLALKGVEIDFVLPYRAEHSVKFMKIHGALPVQAEQLANLGGAYDSYCYECSTDECEHSWPCDLRGQQQRYTKFVRQLVQSTEYDAVHAHDWLTFEAGIQAKQLSGKPLIAHVHATEFDRSGEHSGNPLVHEIEYNGLMMADRVLAVSKFTKDLIVREYSIPADKIEVVHNSVDPSEFGELDPHNAYVYLEQMKRRGHKVVVSVGRLTVQKGFTYLLKAAQRVVEKNPKVFFLIVGDGEQRDELLMQAAELGIAHNVLFTGFVRGKQWRDAYAIGDMFVMSSVAEPFGLTALEAAAHHNAVLLTKQAGVGEVLHSVMRFDFWDTDKLANEILTITQYDHLQQLMADNAWYEFQHLSWHKAADYCKNLYQQVATKEGARA
ncbi:MAG: glycosyltransferase family 4 protein [Candidatus Saccharimonadales bacterium]